MTDKPQTMDTALQLLNALIGLAQICGSAVMAATEQGRNAAAAIAAARGLEP